MTMAGRAWLTVVVALAGLSTVLPMSVASAQSNHLLQVTRTGSGWGTIVSDPPGISCTTTCSALFPAGTVVTLSVTAGDGVPTWRGDCEGSTCAITVDEFKYAVVTLTHPDQPVHVLRGLLPAQLDGRGPFSSEPISDGTYLYGMTAGGGLLERGAIWRSRLDGSEYTLLRSFGGAPDDGRGPRGSLLLVGGVLYGMSLWGGSSDLGTIFKINPDGSEFELIHSFSGGNQDGREPYGSLIASGDVLFGMTSNGGSSYRGTVFKVNTDGTGFALVHTFVGGADDGRMPLGSLTLNGSILYGMTQNGGANDLGTVFSVNTDGSGFTLMHSFAGGPADGKYPHGSLVLSGSSLYGMAAEGGAVYRGIVFSIDTGGAYTVLYSLSSGPSTEGYPYGSLTLVGSELFGMTYVGGASDRGAIFKVGTDGSGFAAVHSFAGAPSDGNEPWGSLTLQGGVLFGMTRYGGASDRGSVFAISPDGTGFTLLHSFPAGGVDGVRPFGSPLLAGGVLYGLSAGGGAFDEGAVFKINQDGTGYEVLHSFAGDGTDGRAPVGDLILSGTTLFGMTPSGGSVNNGTVFRIETDGTGYAVLHSFTGGAGDGRSPNGSLVLAGDTLYGTTYSGGASNMGTVFSIGSDGGAFTLLHSFAGGSDDGSYPAGSLTVSGSVLFGTTVLGGAGNSGTVFKIGTDASGFQVLHGFAGSPADGRSPHSSLVLSGSTLYGTTYLGGASNLGSAFRVDTDGTGFSLLHSFAGGTADGKWPIGSPVLSGTVLYGFTYNGGGSNRGTIYRISTDGTGYEVLRSFSRDASDASEPYNAHPVLASGLIFGLSRAGGPADLGTVFSYPRCPDIALSPATLPNAVLYQPYSQAISASGGVAPYSFSTADTLPAGLSLDSDGVVSGTPTVLGTFTFTVAVTDAALCSDDQLHTLTIDCPVITVLPESLPDGAHGVAYSQALTGSGGTGPYSFAHSAGTLPAGLAVTASGLEGTPTASGTFTFTVTATDDSGCPGSREYTLTIVPLADLSIAVDDLPDPVGTGQQLSYTIEVGNLGPSAATGVTVTDPLPAGTGFVTAASSQGSCAESSGTVTCTLGVLAASGGATITLVVDAPDSPGSIDNTAMVVGLEGDPSPSNNSATTSTMVGILEPRQLLVDSWTGASTASDLNGVLEPGETVLVVPSWLNDTVSSVALTGVVSDLTGPAGSYSITDGVGAYGSVPAGVTANCHDATGDCYELAVAGPRPATHWDATFVESLSNGQARQWTLHIGESFGDVPRSYLLYWHVERLLHNGVTMGCTATEYCPSGNVARGAMSMFLARAMAGSDAAVPVSGTVATEPYDCVPAGVSLFEDVAPEAQYCRHAHYIMAHGVTLGCEATRYCPATSVSRAQMAMFIARAMAGGDSGVPAAYTDPDTGRGYDCGATTPDGHFDDVPPGVSYCRHVHFLWAHGVTDGCTATTFCPSLEVSRGQMAKFLGNGFGLALYGP